MCTHLLPVAPSEMQFMLINWIGRLTEQPRIEGVMQYPVWKHLFGALWI